MSCEKDTLVVAVEALQAAVAEARAKRATGVVVLEVHTRDGAPASVKIRAERVVR